MMQIPEHTTTQTSVPQVAPLSPQTIPQVSSQVQHVPQPSRIIVPADALAKPSQGVWFCPRCTYENTDTLSCEMCATPHPSSARQPSDPIILPPPQPTKQQPQQVPQYSPHFITPTQNQQRFSIQPQEVVRQTQEARQEVRQPQEAHRPQEVHQPQEVHRPQEVPCPICTFYRPSFRHKCDMCGYVP